MLTNNKCSCGAKAPQVEAKASTLRSHFADVARPFKVGQRETMQNMINPKHKIMTNSKSEILNPKQSQMTKIQNSKQSGFWYLNLDIRICLGFRN